MLAPSARPFPARPGKASNSTWLQVQNLDFEDLKRWGYRDFFDWVKERSHLFRGVVFGTMLHDDAFRFISLGTFIERADNTARILDVKYHVLLPRGEQVGGYDRLLPMGRAVALGRRLPRLPQRLSRHRLPWRIAELLILREDMPRSLHHCYQNLIGTLDELAGKKELECRRSGRPDLCAAQIWPHRRDLPAQACMNSSPPSSRPNNALGMQIQEDFLMIPAAVAGAA